MTLLALPLALGLCSLLAAAITREAVMAEPNLEKRSEKAVQYAEAELDKAAKAYEHGEIEAMKTSLQEVSGGVQICLESLEATGKDGRRNPKYFKRAEINIRKLLRKLENLRFAAAVDDRPPIRETIESVQHAHERILADIMSKDK